MAAESRVSELTQTDHGTAGIQLLVSSLHWDSPIPGVSVSELNEPSLDETVYRIGITGEINPRSPSKVELSLPAKATLEMTETPESTSFHLHTDGDVFDLSPIEVISGTQLLNLELPQSTALADVDTSGLTLDLVESEYLDEPYYMTRLNGFVIEASSHEITLATNDNKKFCLKAQRQENVAIAHVDQIGNCEFETIRGLEGGLIFPE